MVTGSRTCLIDASTAHRTAGGWAFGLPELTRGQREAIRASKRIANPGCHASAFILAVRPLVDAGVLGTDARITATSITGYSGGGKSMIAKYEAGGDAKLDSPRPYALGLAHKHLPEMTVHTGLASPPVFMPIVADFYKGLAVMVPLHLGALRPGTRLEHVHEILATRYAGERFVRVMPARDADTLADGFFDVQACNDTNRVDLCVFGSETQAVVIARLDNLGKGASGAAVQSMNVHLGVDEGLGL
jgi:N-acetyl-gamma-glutamyl-phosphate reductase